MSSTATIAVNMNATLVAQYQRTDDPINPNNIIDALNYTDLKDVLTNGHTTDKANLLSHFESTLNNATEYWDLDGGNVYDAFNNLLNFDAVKCFVIRNKETTPGLYLEVHFKNERYYIGPNAYRVVWEPSGPGIAAIVSSASHEEGRISVTSNGSITYDIILIGATAESSSGL